MQTPFQVRCSLCNTLAVSWHRDFPYPEGTSPGMAWCECGNVGADSSGVAGRGRVVTDQPDNAEIIEVDEHATTRDLGALAKRLGGSVEVEDFGYYLTTPGVADDIELGRTAKGAKATLARMLDRAIRAEALRNDR